MDEDLSLGIDLGTTSVKVCLYRIKDETLVSSNIKPTESTIQSDIGPSGSEQDPSLILKAVQECLTGVPLEQRRCVKCMAVTGQMHGVMLWKKQLGNPCFSNDTDGFSVQGYSQLFTWQDQRCSPGFLSTLPEPDSHFPVNTGHGCATLFWLTKHKPEFLVDGKYTHAGTVMDYLVWILCGLERSIMTVQNANSWGYFNNKQRTWNKDRLRDAGFAIHLLPDVAEPGHIAGKLNFDWLGISAGIPVFAALGDLQSYVYSALDNPTDAVLNLSTSSQVVFAVKDPKIPDKPDSSQPVQFFPYFGGNYIAVAASLNGGNVLSQFVDMLANWTKEFGSSVNKDDVWATLIQKALEKSSATGLNVVPTIFGERHLPLQTASVMGITCDNLDLGSVFKSMCNGLVANLCNMMSPSYLKQNGITRLIGTGSVISRNPIVKQEVEMQYGILDIIFGESCDSAAGAAIYALRNYNK